MRGENDSQRIELYLTPSIGHQNERSKNKHSFLELVEEKTLYIHPPRKGVTPWSRTLVIDMTDKRKLLNIRCRIVSMIGVIYSRPLDHREKKCDTNL